MMKPMEELVSVIVPVYNIEDYLPRCLACIKAQTYTNLEIILVDDGSTDGSGRLCDEYAASDPRARVIHHPENRGLWAARNTGQDAATGEYLWMPDGDDYFHKDIVKWMYEAINQTSSSGKKYDLAIVGHRQTSRFDEDVTSVVNPSFANVSLEEVLEVFVRPRASFTGRNVWNKLCRKTFAEDIRSGEYKYAQDCDFSLKLYKKDPAIVFVDKQLYFFVDRPFSTRTAADYGYISNMCIIRIIDDAFTTQPKVPVFFQRFLLEDLYIRMATLQDLAQGTSELSSARQECRKMVSHTWWTYLRCRTNKPFIKRFFRVLRVRFDGLYRLWA